MKKAIVAAILAMGLAGCVSDDYEWVNSRSAAYYQQRGFSIVGYQGYDFHPQGRCYWYTLERMETVYESCLLRWGNEVHEYNLRALNAVKGN